MAGTIVVDKVAESPNNVKTVTTSLSNQIAISSNADQRSVGIPILLKTELAGLFEENFPLLR
jgi:hypothetical protein